MDIKKILQRGDGVKYIIIPKDSDLKKGDYAQIMKINNKSNREVQTN